MSNITWTSHGSESQATNKDTTKTHFMAMLCKSRNAKSLLDTQTQLSKYATNCTLMNDR